MFKEDFKDKMITQQIVEEEIDESRADDSIMMASLHSDDGSESYSDSETSIKRMSDSQLGISARSKSHSKRRRRKGRLSVISEDYKLGLTHKKDSIDANSVSTNHFKNVLFGKTSKSL